MEHSATPPTNALWSRNPQNLPNLHAPGNLRPFDPAQDRPEPVEGRRRAKGAPQKGARGDPSTMPLDRLVAERLVEGRRRGRSERAKGEKRLTGGAQGVEYGRLFGGPPMAKRERHAAESSLSPGHSIGRPGHGYDHDSVSVRKDD